MQKRSAPRTGFATEKQKQATYENLAIGQMKRLQNMLQTCGHYDFQLRAQELEEQFRAKIKEK